MTADHSHQTVLKRASIITLITLLSRIVGYLRDQRITFLLGSGLAADAFSASYRFADILRRLVSEGAISASFVPIFTHNLRTKNRAELGEFVNSLFSIITLILSALTLLGILFPLWVFATAAGFIFNPTGWKLSVQLNKIMLIYVVFIGLTAVASGILNCFHRYAVPAFTPVVFNLSIIAASFAGGYLGDPQRAAKWMAVGVVIGGIMQVLIQLPLLEKLGFRLKPVLLSYSPEVKKVLSCMLPGFLGVGVYHLGQLINTLYASFQVGGASSLWVADRVIELAMGGYVISFATAVLPIFSDQAASDQIAAMKRTIAFSI